MPNPVTHFEIAGQDGERLESFYAGLFDWKVEAREIAGNRYAYLETGSEEGLTGGIRHEPDGRAEIVLYVEVEDLEASIARAEGLGATIRIPPMETPEVTFALIEDPEGNPIGLIQSA